jgi:hypothetical protein
VSENLLSAEWFAGGTVDPRKLDDYLLSPTHPTGRHKARLWSSVFGISEGDGRLLEQLIREQLYQAEPVEREKTRATRRWELVMPRFRGPNGKEGPVRTAWALEVGKSRPHLTTAFPIVHT